MTIARSLALLAAALPPLLAQPPKPFTAQAASTISYTTSKDGEPVVEINNVDYDVSGEAPPGRPAGSRLVLRKTTHSRQVIGDMGIESTVTLEAWPLGAALQSKPLYSLKPEAVEAHTIDNAFWLVDRTTDPDVAWWSVYQLGTGKHLFDTYTDLLRFTVSRANGDPRYAGLEVPPDDSPDPRLKEPHVLAILSYASPDKVIRELILTCENPQRARELRSYEDNSRTLTLQERPAGRTLRISITASYPSPARSTVVVVPIVKDDLDIAHAELPPGFRIAIWKR